MLNNLETKYLGKNNYYYKVIDSTQKKIWRLYRNNACNGTLVYADIQTSGIGTHGRTWYTDCENNIAFSYLLKPNCNISKLNGLTLEIAEIITSIFKDNYQINLNIKYPNDIVYKDKKLGGILVETKIEKEIVKALVIGIGINTNQKKFNNNIEKIATSISNCFDIEISKETFIVEFCNRFEKKFIKRLE